MKKPTPRPTSRRTPRAQTPRPANKPYILCIGKWTAMALTAEKHGFVLEEQKDGKQ